MQLDHENFSDREDAEDAIAAHRNRLARARGAQPIEHEDAKRLLRETAGMTSRIERVERTSEELVRRAQRMPHIDYAEMRAEADAIFGENRLGDDDPWDRAGSPPS